VDFQQRLLEDGFADKLVSSDEATFRVSGKVNFARNFHCTVTIDSDLANSKTQNTFLSPVIIRFCHDCPLAVKLASTPWRLLPKQSREDSLAIDMLLSAVSVLVVALPISEISNDLILYMPRKLLYT
jgi:hypothetical protein